MNTFNRNSATALGWRMSEKRSLATTLIDRAAELWFLVAIAGQWFFAAYVAIFYGSALFNGNVAKWNDILPHGYVEGNLIGNIIVGAHLLMAVVIILGGPLQIISGVRNRFRQMHRWSGRMYLITALVISVSGVVMVFTRGTVGGTTQAVGITINAALIILFSALALKTARTRNFPAHRRWTLRLFLAVSGVWFFRVAFMLWMMIHQRPVGFDPETFTGPVLTVIGFGQYLFPLAVLETYFLVRRRDINREKIATALFLFLLTLVMGAGIFAAIAGMWLPRL